MARGVRLRGRGGSTSNSPTLSARVSQRLSGRGVDPALAEWDSARSDGGGWTVVLTFPAGGRERQARWSFDVQSRTVSAADDEARWLSEEDSDAVTSPLPAPHLVSSPVRATQVYDVEAEGGVGAAGRRMPSQGTDEPVDLMTAMRERASHRGRPRRRKGPASQTPLDEAPREDALPLEDLDYDPESMPAPPAARGAHPIDAQSDASDARPASQAEAEPDSAGPGDLLGVGDDVLPAADRPRGSSSSAGNSSASTKAPTPASTSTAGGVAAKRPVKKGARRSVPSWDDVMFGAKPQD
jgi:hypothetical protein